MNKMQDLKKKHDILKAKNDYLALLSAYEKEKVEEETFDPLTEKYNMYFERAKIFLERNTSRMSGSKNQEHFDFLNKKKDRIPTDALITEGNFLGYNIFGRNVYYASWWYKKNWERIIRWFVFGE